VSTLSGVVGVVCDVRGRDDAIILVVVQMDDRHGGALPVLDRLPDCSHVCWVVDSPARFERWTAACLADGARRGQRLLRFVPQARAATAPGDLPVTVLDPAVAVLGGGPLDRAAMYSSLRAAAASARDEGYRGLRLVADMDWLATPAPTPVELAAYELLLDEVVTELGATVVCAYRTESFAPDTVAEAVAAHPSTAGPIAVDPGFRFWNVRGAVWEVSGEIDLFNADAFGRALATAAVGVSSMRLRAVGLRFIAVAGLGAIVDVTRSRPDLRIVVEGAGPSFTLCWTLLGYDRLVQAVRFAGTDPTRAGFLAPPVGSS
jgi:hypothetical protein